MHVWTAASAHLDSLAVDVTRRVTEELVRQVSAVRVELLSDRRGRLSSVRSNTETKVCTDIKRLASKQYDLVELRKVRQEVVDTRALYRLPATSALRTMSYSDTRFREYSRPKYC